MLGIGQRRKEKEGVEKEKKSVEEKRDRTCVEKRTSRHLWKRVG